MNSRGFILLDTLVALTIVLFACFHLLPIWVQIANDRQDILKERKAQQILYANLQGYYRAQQFNELVIDESGTGQYKFTLVPSPTKNDFNKGCVSYKNSDNKTVTFCEEIQERTGLYTP